MFVHLLGRKMSRTPTIRPNNIILTKMQGLQSSRKILKLLKSFYRKRKMEKLLKRDGRDRSV